MSASDIIVVVGAVAFVLIIHIVRTKRGHYRRVTEALDLGRLAALKFLLPFFENLAQRDDSELKSDWKFYVQRFSAWLSVGSFMALVRSMGVDEDSFDSFQWVDTKTRQFATHQFSGSFDVYFRNAVAEFHELTAIHGGQKAFDNTAPLIEALADEIFVYLGTEELRKEMETPMVGAASAVMMTIMNRLQQR